MRIAGSGEPVTLRPFTRLRIDGRDPAGLLVTCLVCLPAFAGHAMEQDLLFHPLAPEAAAWGTLAEFALAVRSASDALDIAALRPVMNEEFSYGFFGPQNPESAFDAWFSDNFRSLSRVAEIVDGGFSTRDSIVWSAPPAYDETMDYRGLRLGFRQRDDGRWEWLYLIEGLNP